MKPPTNRQHAEKIVSIISERGFHRVIDDIAIVEQYLNMVWPEKTEEELRVGAEIDWEELYREYKTYLSVTSSNNLIDTIFDWFENKLTNK